VFACEFPSRAEQFGIHASLQVVRTWSSAVVRDNTSIVARMKVLIFRIRALSYGFMRLA